jgi:hypothetical protein
MRGRSTPMIGRRVNDRRERLDGAAGKQARVTAFPSRQSATSGGLRRGDELGGRPIGGFPTFRSCNLYVATNLKIVP